MARYIIFISFVMIAFSSKAQATHEITVAVNQGTDCPVVAGLEESDLFKVFPNPVTSSFTVQSEILDANIKLTDMHGRVVRDGNLKEGELEVDVSALNGGIYILHVQSGQLSDHIKIKIQ